MLKCFQQCFVNSAQISSKNSIPFLSLNSEKVTVTHPACNYEGLRVIWHRHNLLIKFITIQNETDVITKWAVVLLQNVTILLQNVMLILKCICTSRAFSSSLLHAIFTRNHLSIFKIFSSFVHFAQIFNYFALFVHILTFFTFLTFFWIIARTPF